MNPENPPHDLWSHTTEDMVLSFLDDDRDKAVRIAHERLSGLTHMIADIKAAIESPDRIPSADFANWEYELEQYVEILDEWKKFMLEHNLLEASDNLE